MKEYLTAFYIQNDLLNWTLYRNNVANSEADIKSKPNSGKLFLSFTLLNRNKNSYHKNY